MKNKNVLAIIFGMLYYLIPVILYYLLFVLNMMDGIIHSFSVVLFIVCIFVMPILFIFLPIIFSKILKKEWYKAFLYSFIINVIYVIIILPSIRFGIVGYMKSFSKSKWNNYANLRYIMVDDLEKNYNLIGKKTNDVKKLLGKPDSSFKIDKSMCYFIKGEFFLNSYYYCLEYDENNIITETFKPYGDW